ncbi:MAG: hypothetical protein ACM3Y9_09000 [Ignavibacteria bacterium]
MSSPRTNPTAEARHRFILVIAVADRPQHLRACLDSLLELQRRFPYGDGSKISVLIADDSEAPAHVADNRALAAHYGRLGIPTVHFAPGEQLDLVESLGAQREALRRVIGDAPRERFSHKGQGAMRNIAGLKLARMLADAGDDVLIWWIDSDQEFRVKTSGAHGDEEPYAVDFFHALDAIFSRSDAAVLTGKVVGDPPVSPAVMTANFLDDVIAFLAAMAQREPHASCSHHVAADQRQGEAAYHDMADLFGFARREAYRYRCPLPGRHDEADCFLHFAARLGGFFHGEHPTRVSYYVADDPLASVQPARTVYAGNCVFRASALEYFLPFANLRLRMSGPTLGRLIRARIGPRFVSANLPMLHRRTVGGTSAAEFRPGVRVAAEAVDMGGEFERQFYGDVMLFCVERLTALGYPLELGTAETLATTLDTVRDEMLERYNARHAAIRAKLADATALLRGASRWWNAGSAHADAVAHFEAFFANVARNFAENSAVCRGINATEAWAAWRARLLDALAGYPEDCRNWQRVLGRAAA